MQQLKMLLYPILNKSIGKFFGIIPQKAKYNYDGIATFHVAHFMDDYRFVRAYSKGKETGSWNKGDIPWRAYVACWAASHVKNIEGDFVECGVYRGGLSRTVIDYINFEELTQKKFYLFDAYGPIPLEYVHEDEFKLITRLILNMKMYMNL
ncbi:MAG: hypothetical protein RIQ33_498 [Bacteroidota bacterium]|jgi:hypothetical protein